MNIASIIVLFLIILCIIWAILSIRKRKKSGKPVCGSCSGDCSQCLNAKAKQ